MDNRLREIVLQIIRETWAANEGGLASETIHRQLLDLGESVPEGAMDEIFSRLESRHLIRTAKPLGSAGIKAHGGIVITYVDPSLL
jgi:hypothetical protein